MITLREFRLSDVPEFGSDLKGDQVLGMTAEIEGKFAACGGVRQVLGHNWVFFRVRDERALQPVFLHRTIKAALAALDDAGMRPLLAFCDHSRPRAEAWLLRLGFRPLLDDEKDWNIRVTEGSIGKNSWILE